MPAPTKYKPEEQKKYWRKKANKIIKMRKEVDEIEKRLRKKQAKETGIITPKVIGDPQSKMPIIGSKKYPWSSQQGEVLAPDLGPTGTAILNDDGTWSKVLEAKRGKLFKKLGRAALAGATLYGMSKFKMSPLTGAKIKTLPVKMTNIGVPEITGSQHSLLDWGEHITLESGGEVILGKNVDKDLL